RTALHEALVEGPFARLVEQRPRHPQARENPVFHRNARSQFLVNSRKFVTHAAAPSTAGRAPDQGCLYRSFRIFSVRILYSRVDAGRPSLAAAPDRPDTFPLASASAPSIISRSRATSASSSGRIGGCAAAISRDSQFSSTTSVSVSHTMTARSITFWSSRTLPGHRYDLTSSSVRLSTWRIVLPAL